MPTGIYIRTKPAWNKGKPFLVGERHPMFGKHHSKETKEKMKLNHKGTLGKFRTNINYFSLHAWVKRWKGKPTKCVNGHIAKHYVWANISGEYKRDLSDWHELCYNCNHTDGIKIHPRFL